MSRLPWFVEGGYVRDDLVDENEAAGVPGPWLRGGRIPNVSQLVTLEIFLPHYMNSVMGRVPMISFLMDGRVSRVLDQRNVDIVIRATSDAPRSARGEWCARLTVDEKSEFPWVLIGMAQG